MTRHLIENGILTVPPRTRQGTESRITTNNARGSSVYAISLWPVTLRHKDLDTGSIDFSTSYVPRIRFDSDGKVDHLDYLTLLGMHNSSTPRRNHPGDADLVKSVTDGLNSEKRGSLARRYRLEKESMDPEGILKLMSIVLEDCIGAEAKARTTDAEFEDSDSERDDELGEWSFGGSGTLSLNSKWYKLQIEDPRDTPWRIPGGTNDIERYLAFPHTATSALMLMTDDLLDVSSTRTSQGGTSRNELTEDSEIFKYCHVTVDD